MSGLGLAPGAAATVTPLAVASLLLIAAAILTGRWPVWVAGLLVAVVTVAAAFLYRDPPTPRDGSAVVVLAPADGRVVAIDSVRDHVYMGRLAHRVRLQAGLLDVHVLRSPVDGVVDYLAYNSRRGLVGISTGQRRILLEHQPGATPLVREGQLVDRGQRTGVLPLRSRLELLLPIDLELLIAAGDRIHSGATAVAVVQDGVQ